MKKTLLFLFIFLTGYAASAQLLRLSNFYGSTPTPVRLPDMSNLDGSPYLTEDFKSAYVKVKNGYFEYNVPVRINIYSNEVVVNQGGSEFTLDSLDMLLYLDKPGDSNTLHIFKTGYPSVDSKNEASIYEVLAMGPKAHLLKFTSQRIEPVKSMGVYDKKQLVTNTQLYIYQPKYGISRAKGDKKVLLDLFRKDADKIEALIADNKLNLKRESDLAELITLLNKTDN